MTVVLLFRKKSVHKNPLEKVHCRYDALSVSHQFCPLILRGIMLEAFVTNGKPKGITSKHMPEEITHQIGL